MDSQEMKVVALTVPMIERQLNDARRHLDVTLSVVDGETIETLRQTLVEEGAKYVSANGVDHRPVWSLADAARWLIQQLGKEFDNNRNEYKPSPNGRRKTKRG